MSTVRLILALVVAAAAGCDPAGGEAGSRGWATVGGEALEVTVGPDLCECLSVAIETEFGAMDGPGALSQVTQFVVTDPQGRFWVSQPGGPQVFDRTGNHIVQIGARGRGPGEFEDQGPIYVDRGRVHVVDGGNARVTVFEDLRYVDDWRIPGYVLAAVPLSDGAVLVNMPLVTPEAFGEPLHIVRRDSILSSFGLMGTGHERLDNDRVIAASPDGLLYSFRRNELTGNEWETTGAHRRRIHRVGLWEPPPDGRATPLTPLTPQLYGVVKAARFTADGLLQVIVWVPTRDYRAHLKEARGPGGSILVPADGEEALFDAVLEVIDLSAGEVVARGELPDLAAGFVDEERIFSTPVVGVGIPVVRVWRVTRSEPE